MSLIADISSGNTGFADVCYLVAVILLALAAFAALATITDPPRHPYGRWSAFLGWLGVAFIALGNLVL